MCDTAVEIKKHPVSLTIRASVCTGASLSLAILPQTASTSQACPGMTTQACPDWRGARASIVVQRLLDEGRYPWGSILGPRLMVKRGLLRREP